MYSISVSKNNMLADKKKNLLIDWAVGAQAVWEPSIKSLHSIFVALHLQLLTAHNCLQPSEVMTDLHAGTYDLVQEL